MIVQFSLAHRLNKQQGGFVIEKLIIIEKLLVIIVLSLALLVVLSLLLCYQYYHYDNELLVAHLIIKGLFITVATTTGRGEQPLLVKQEAADKCSLHRHVS